MVYIFRYHIIFCFKLRGTRVMILTVVQYCDQLLRNNDNIHVVGEDQKNVVLLGIKFW